ncbi:hypothetical protein T4D_4508 [Trichinella pseudospiralis]|uniref:Uncharacterized protein n=1 Tax=Trichinella pseudospiralis TaxID=6337 RepID=A0A0V1FM52_TRIPS|nr:hypothetical protein T4D_4508 [Trichinella pseudospiralis]
MIDYEMQRLKSSFEVAGSVVLGEILLTERAKLLLNLARKISICQAAVTHSDRTDDEHMAGCCFMFGTIDTHVLRDENFKEQEHGCLDKKDTGRNAYSALLFFHSTKQHYSIAQLTDVSEPLQRPVFPTSVSVYWLPFFFSNDFFNSSKISCFTSVHRHPILQEAIALLCKRSLTKPAFGAQFSGSFFISSRCRGCYVAIDTNSPPAENRRAVSQERRKAHVLCELNILKSVFSQNTKGPSSNKQQKKIRTADMRDSIEHNVMEFDPIPARLCYLATCYITESNRSRLDLGELDASRECIHGLLLFDKDGSVGKNFHLAQN